MSRTIYLMTQEVTANINIKGIRDGLLMTVDSQPVIEDLLDELSLTLNEKAAFLRDSRIALDVGLRLLNREQLSDIQTLFAQHGIALWAILSHREGTREAARDLGFATRLPGSQMDLQGNGRPEPMAQTTRSRPSIPPNALFVRETIRSGRAIYYEGHVVIFGDVNPGAEIVADGDIIVWGRLRGLVHAGALGDMSATISALDLAPTQLRIADHIAVTPPPDRQHHVTPETALIRNNQIIAEPWG